MYTIYHIISNSVADLNMCQAVHFFDTPNFNILQDFDKWSVGAHNVCNFRDPKNYLRTLCAARD